MAKGHYDGDKWVVAKGECLYKIAAYKEVYNNGNRWTEIADANGISRKKTTIYPNQKLKIPGRSSSTTTKPSTSETSTKVTGKKVKITWFHLDADETRQMFCVWQYDREHTDHYVVKWEYNTGQGGWRVASEGDTKYKQAEYAAPEQAKKVRVSIKPIAKQHTVKNKQEYYWKDGEWQKEEYDYSNNPPGLIGPPNFTIDSTNKLTAEYSSITPLNNLNADSIELAIYKDDTTKYSTVTAPIVIIESDTGYFKYECQVESGFRYKLRARAVRNTDITGGWSDYTENIYSSPVAPTEITTLETRKYVDQSVTTYAAFLKWPEVPSAKVYTVQYTTDPNFEVNINEFTTQEGEGPSALISDIELGHVYYFRVYSVNDQGRSIEYSPVYELSVGQKPAAPTTSSNTTKGIVGEDIKIYWVHNSTDGSLESRSSIEFNIYDASDPSHEHPTTRIITLENDRPEEDKAKTREYTINSTDPYWSLISNGCLIKWKVRTAGVSDTWSDWSVEREINVYTKPTVTIGLLDDENLSIDDVHGFPFYITILAEPNTQVPISYYIEILSKDSYETIDDFGKIKMVSAGDTVYQKYYDPQNNPWSFLLEMTPGNIDLEPEKEYTINVTVAMDSGLSATNSLDFTAFFEDLFYDVFAEVVINKETLEAAIHPYCYEYNIIDEYYSVLTEEPEDWDSTYINYYRLVNQEYVLIDDLTAPEFITNTFYEYIVEQEKTLVENCKLAVYRHEYDGTFVEIAKDLDNINGLYVTDPHPSLDYARYRITAKLNDTGAISYGDVKPVKIGETSLIIQWAEKWESFMSDDEGSGMVESPWSGSMLKLPYNVDVNENRNVDVSLVEYAGRKRPVSYYGTQIREGASLSSTIAKDDKETLYALRRLSIWDNDVYIREPSGVGYWATISVSYDLKHSDITIPVSISVTRVEGGI